MTKTIRLIYPQWQGANIRRLLPEFSEADASTGYVLGANLLNFLSPETKNKIITVPVSVKPNRKEKNGILDYDVILKQTKSAIDILNKENPSKIAVLGGECSVSVVPFTYLAEKYKNDVVMIWIDAHLDITLPSDKTYNGYHAMAAAAIMGMGDEKIMELLPSKIEPENVLFVGLRDWERDEIKQRQKELKIKHLSPDETKNDGNKVIDWIKQTGKTKVVIHFDLDVLDPNEIIAAAGIVDNGMKIEEVIRVINDINKEFEITGLTVAEPVPRYAIKLRNMLKQLPLI